MSLRSWLYGDVLRLRSQREPSHRIYDIAPLTVNVDDLKDFEAKLRQYVPSVEIFATARHGTTVRTVGDVDELLAMPPYDRKQIEFGLSNTAGAEAERVNSAVVHFFSWHPANAVIYDVASAERVVLEALAVLSDKARRRLPSSRLVTIARALLFVSAAALYGSACWQLWRVETAALLIVVGLLAIMPYLQCDAWLKVRVAQWGKARDGVRIEMVSRARLEADRRNSKRDWKVGVVIGPIGVLAGALLTHWLW